MNEGELYAYDNETKNSCMVRNQNNGDVIILFQSGTLDVLFISLHDDGSWTNHKAGK